MLPQKNQVMKFTQVYMDLHNYVESFLRRIDFMEIDDTSILEFSPDNRRLGTPFQISNGDILLKVLDSDSIFKIRVEEANTKLLCEILDYLSNK